MLGATTAISFCESIVFLCEVKGAGRYALDLHYKVGGRSIGGGAPAGGCQ